MKIGRNDLCICGSNKKYKKCCIDKDCDMFCSLDDITEIPSIESLYEKFNHSFNSFDYNAYNEIASNRDLDETGRVKSSHLIQEIAHIAAFFVNEKIRQSISVVDCCYCAFTGWQLSHDVLAFKPTASELRSSLIQGTELIYQDYQEMGIDLTKSEIAWLIFCCAMIKEKLYQDFNYDMQAIRIIERKGEPIIQIMAY